MVATIRIKRTKLGGQLELLVTPKTILPLPLEGS